MQRTRLPKRAASVAAALLRVVGSERVLRLNLFMRHFECSELVPSLLRQLDVVELEGFVVSARASFEYRHLLCLQYFPAIAQWHRLVLLSETLVHSKLSS